MRLSEPENTSADARPFAGEGRSPCTEAPAPRHRALWCRRARRTFLICGSAATLLAIALAIAWMVFPFPLERLSRWPASATVTDRTGEPLLTLVGGDEQWRLPIPLEEISPWLIEATIAVEDKRFRDHRGIDPLAVLRATGQNLGSGQVVSGASTLTMQICRMLDDRPRTLRAKIVEAFRALQLERLRDKQAILATYLNIAPYGRNLRGVEAASRYYFGKSAAQLSLGEAALLAGLPQSPSRLRPDRHADRARQRREIVLDRMVETSVITDAQRQQASQEPLMSVAAYSLLEHCPEGTGPSQLVGVLPGPSQLVDVSPRPNQLVDVSPGPNQLVDGFLGPNQLVDGSPEPSQLVDVFLGPNQLVDGLAPKHSNKLPRSSICNKLPRSSIYNKSPRSWHAATLALQRRPAGGRTTIDPDLQTAIERLVDEHRNDLPADTDYAVVAIDIVAAELVAMVGSPDFADPHDGQVNGAIARRSPGSALKPFIYAAAFEAGRLNADAPVYDIPVTRAGWSPHNFEGGFAGSLPAGQALRRSLNVPAILLAEAIGPARCIGLMQAAGVNLPADTLTRGGLAVATGAIEVTLLDLTNAYATLGRGGTWQHVRLFVDEPIEQRSALSPEVCATVDDILSCRNRSPHGIDTVRRADLPWFMWKTGTSSGRRDAWAVGHNHQFAVGVWVGRFSGAGSPAFVGGAAAEPLLAKIFCLPHIRTDRDPPAPLAMLVRWPLPPPAELSDPLRIISPDRNARYVAVAGQAVIHPLLNHPQAATWFLNGRMLAADAVARLILPPGGYELRCCGRDGETSAVTFAVLGSARRGR